MLARVANNLFWMGRYIERSEHIARYMSVNYFSSLDAPHELSQSRQFMLRSMLFMVGEPELDTQKLLNEELVLFNLGLNQEQYYSIISNIKAVRENANSARDLISTELYESINRFYHFVLNYDADFFVKQGLYDFTVNITGRTSVLRGKIRGTLLHDEIYAIILLGINIERAIQIIRIINAKYHDALQAKGSYGDKVANSFEWTTLLKCAESYDMMRRFYRKSPTSITTLEFLILTGDCPRSVMNSLNQINKHICSLDNNKHPKKESTAFLAGKLKSEIEFTTIRDIEEDVKGFIEKLLSRLFAVAQKMEDEFFKF